MAPGAGALGPFGILPFGRTTPEEDQSGDCKGEGSGEGALLPRPKSDGHMACPPLLDLISSTLGRALARVRALVTHQIHYLISALQALQGGCRSKQGKGR